MSLVNRLNIILLFSLVIKEILGDEAQMDDLSNNLINDLYKKYKEAMNRGGDLVILRRQFDHNQLFEIHVKKLKEVNGYKLHNLMIKGKLRSGSPLIYINNPVESKMPNAYLTLEEFKEALTKRVQKPKQTTVKIIDAFFTTKTLEKRIHKTLLTNNTTNDDTKTTRKYILRSSHTKTSLGNDTNVKYYFPPTDATTRKRNIVSNASTEAITVSNTYSIFNTTSKIKDLSFLRTSPTNGNYTQIEKYNIRYSNASVGTDKEYENTTAFINRTLSIANVETNISAYSNYSHSQTEEMKLNRDLVLTSERSKLVNVTEIQDVESIELDISNKTIENEELVNVIKNVTINKHDPINKGIESGNNITSVTIIESSAINNTDTSQNTSFVSPFIIKTTISNLSNDNVTKASIISENPVTFMDTTTKDLTLRANTQQNPSDIYNTTTDTNITEENTDNVTNYPANITTYMAEISYDKTDSSLEFESPTEPVLLERNKQLMLKQNYTLIETTDWSIITSNSTTLEKFKRVPKHAVTQSEAPFGRQTPWRRRTKIRNISKNITAKTKRSTLGRPLVFLGGP